MGITFLLLNLLPIFRALFFLVTPVGITYLVVVFFLLLVLEIPLRMLLLLEMRELSWLCLFWLRVLVFISGCWMGMLRVWLTLGWGVTLWLFWAGLV